MVFQLQGTQNQQRIIRETLDRTDFPWDRLRPLLRQTTGDRDYIPVEWADLSRYAGAAMKERKAGVAGDARVADDGHAHDHDHGHEDMLFHAHGSEDGDEWHAIGYRNQVLGLAWYSGRVSMSLTLESRPLLAAEVFLSEGAHMVDFFYMTDEQRRRVFNAFHGDPDVDPAPHGHDWFDVGSYWDFVGEAFMGGFVRAYSDVPVTIPFTHGATPQIGRWIREILTPELVDPPVPPSPPDAPAPEEPTVPEPEAPQDESEPPSEEDEGRLDYVFGVEGSDVFHDQHHGVDEEVTWADARAALTSGRRPCKTCDPWKNPKVWDEDLEIPEDVR